MKMTVSSMILTLALAVSAAESEYHAVMGGADGKILIQGGGLSPAERTTPCSTFKIPLALIGFETGALQDAEHPVFIYEKEYAAVIKSHEQDQTPASWMKNSCVWTSQILAPQIGMEKMTKYLRDFNYGNADMSGDPGQNNGLTRAWLSSSLKISPNEQMAFMRKLANNELPVSNESVKKTKELIYLEELANGWSFYGKTGSRRSKIKDGEKESAAGYFTGWAEKDGRKYIVFMRLEKPEPGSGWLGPEAKERCKKLLIESGLLK